jgi:hypothetical protein
MNGSRLRQLVEIMLRLDDKHKIQSTIQELSSHLNNLASSPQDSGSQNGFKKTIEKLRVALNDICHELEPAQLRAIIDMDGQQYFIDDIAEILSDKIRNNPITTSVISQEFAMFVQKRAEYLAELTNLRDRLKTFKIDENQVEPGNAEIGFLIPRDIFSNRFDEFLRELNTINTILRIFSELQHGQIETITVSEISASDPLLFFGMSIETIGIVAGVITWGLHTLKTIEDIRKVRAETKKLGIHTQEEIAALFDDKITKKIDTEINMKIKDLSQKLETQAGRSKEICNGLEWALRMILGKIERGWRVEARLGPPASEAPQSSTDALTQLKKSQREMVFPEVSGPAILPLPSEPKEKQDERRQKK